MFSSRHARPERGIQRRRDVGPQLPATDFTRLRIKAQVHVRDPISGRSPPLDTAFPSPAARAGLAACPRSRVNVPGLYLRSNPETSSRLVRFFAPALAGLLCPVKRVPRVNPLPVLVSGLTVCLRTSAPPWDFSIPKDRFPTFRSGRASDSNRRSPPYESPDLPSLPASR